MLIDTILIVDFGSQVTQLIARRAREMSVYSVVIPHNKAMEYLAAHKQNVRGVVFSGGPNSVYEDGAPSIDLDIFDIGIPILGICYGQQLICHLLGGKVEGCATKEYGKAILNVPRGTFSDESKFEGPQLLDLIDGGQVWMSHGDVVTKIPKGFATLGTTDGCPFAVIANTQKKIYGIQFHPEVTHSTIGGQILRNFILGICECKQDWQMKNYMESAIDKVKKQIGNYRAICALSGGVDSTVAAEIVRRAIGDKLTCVFVDTGLMRKGEGEEVKKMFGDNLVYVDAKEIFFKELRGVSDPEKKRKIIGKLFIDIFTSEATRINSQFLKNNNGIDSGDIPVEELKNIGPVMTKMLNEMGIFTKSDLVKYGIYKAYSEIRAKYGAKHMNIMALYALFLAIKGVPFQKLTHDIKKYVNDRFEEFKKSAKEKVTEEGEMPNGQQARVKYLVQGTIYPDVIESATGGSAKTIKSHHNVGGLPKKLGFDLVEPLRDLFKDEVRKLGEELNVEILAKFEAKRATELAQNIDKLINNGEFRVLEAEMEILSNMRNGKLIVPRGTISEKINDTRENQKCGMLLESEIVKKEIWEAENAINAEASRLHGRIWRHPFPGPGLAIRILGDITEEKVKILQEADAIYIEELKKNGLYNKIWQAFCVLTNSRTVGVMGDNRTYEYVLAVRAVTSVDGMTADFYPFEMEFLKKLSNRITNEVAGISRIAYDVTSKPPATIEWE